jgi:competence protein ComEA
MDNRQGVPQTVPTAALASAPQAGLRAVWPRSLQVAVSALLVATLGVLACKSLLQSLEAGSSTIPAQRIDLNAATHAELLLLPGVGENLADRIAKARGEVLFKTVDDLRRVPGIGPATLERLRGWVYVSANPIPAPMETSLPLAVAPSKRPGAKPKKGADLDGPIDVNTAAASQLMQIPGIGPKLSQRIVEERAQRPFQMVADLRRVHGIGPKILEKLRPFVTVAPAAKGVSSDGPVQ